MSIYLILALALALTLALTLTVIEVEHELDFEQKKSFAAFSFKHKAAKGESSVDVVDLVMAENDQTPKHIAAKYGMDLKVEP